jgi:hypothetical protein
VNYPTQLGVLLAFAVMAGGCPSPFSIEPVRLIFDTDIGNDVDDALALGVIHSLQSRGECELIAVTISKDHELSAPFADAVNTFYGRGDIPIGVVRSGPSRGASRFTGLARLRDDGELRYPHDLTDSSEAPEATELLRSILARQPDRSVVIVQVGFSTNLARLLDSPPDAHSPLGGLELVEEKVQLLSVMAGAFRPISGKTHLEHNVVGDIPSARVLAERWPTPIVYSGFEIGIAIPYPAMRIRRGFDYVEHHPLAEAYRLYSPRLPDLPTWDMTSVLQAVRPDHGYFGQSPRGRVLIAEDGAARFEVDPEGLHRHLTVQPSQVRRVREALVRLSSDPPHD